MTPIGIRKAFLLFLSSVSCAAAASGQVPWWGYPPQWQNPRPFANNLTAVFFASPSTGWCVGNAGSIVRTMTGGNTWDVVESGTETDLNAVFFVDTQHGWTVGRDLILRSTNGGYSWLPANSPVPANLSSVYFLDTRRGWACGDSVLLSSSDGGSSWQESPLPGANSLASVTFSDGNTGWIVGSRCAYRSTDAGESWQTSLPDSLFSRIALEKIEFTTASTGVLIGTESFPASPNAVKIAGFLFKTTDEGASWSTLLSDTVEFSFYYPYRYFQDLVFADSLTGYYASENGAARTTDGGATWQEASPAFLHGRYAMPAPGSLFSADASGLIAASTDGGTTWEEQSHGTRATITGIQHFGDTKLVASGTRGYLDGSVFLKSYDGGQQWSVVTTMPDKPTFSIMSISFPDSLHGWVAGAEYYSGSYITNNGLILRTTDGGNSWTQQTDDSTRHRLFAIDFTDLQHGVAAGSGQILTTTDGGTTWNVSYDDPYWYPELHAAEMIDSVNIWCGGLGTLMSSSNGGMTWKMMDTLAGMKTFSINAILFDGALGWIAGSAYDPFVGETGFILRTTDAGDSWTTASSGGPPLHAIDEFNGSYRVLWAVGDRGALAISANEGAGWTLTTLPHVTVDLGAVSLLSYFYGWCGGQTGAILAVNSLGPCAVEAGPVTVKGYRLDQNYPNPFNPTTTIRYEVPASLFVTLKVYDLLGREVSTLVNGRTGAGVHEVKFVASGLSSGVYICRLQAGDYVAAKKLLLVK